MKSILAKQPDGTIQLTITIPHVSVTKTREEIVGEMIKHVSMPGFRKGKAPRNLAEKKLDEHIVKEEILKKLLPEFYAEAVKEHSLKPIVSPRILMEKIENGKDWVFKALICEMPEITLGEYKKKVGEITARGKIVIPGQEQQKQASFDDIAKSLLENVKVTIPSVLKEGEVDRLLSQLIDDIKKLGMTLDQYLASSGKTPQALRAEYDQKVESDIKMEFILQKIGESEKITVDEKEIEEAIQKAKDEKEKEHLKANRYLLANILKQQKTLDFLKNL